MAILSVSVWIIVAVLIFEIFWYGYFGFITKVLAKKIKHFKDLKDLKDLKNYSSNNNRGTVLIAGDSTALSVGAISREETLDYFIEKNLNKNTDNISKTAIKTSELLEILDKISQKRFDLIIIMIGGMDIIKFTPFKKLSQDLLKVISLTKKMSSGNVLLVIPGNAGVVPMFHFPFSTVYSNRALKIQQIFSKIAEETGIKSVTLEYSSHKNLFSPDKIHPNALGYKLWWQKITNSK